MGRTSPQFAGVLLVVGLLAAMHVIGLRASMLGVSFAAVALAALATGPLRLSRAPVDSLVLALSAWILLVTIPRLGAWEPAFQLTVYLLLPLSFLAVRRLEDVETDRLMDAMVLVLASLGAVALAYGISGENQSPIFLNRNNQAALLNMGALLAAGMAFDSEPQRLRRYGLLTAVVVLAAGAMLAGSRGAMLGLCAGLIVTVVVARDQIRRWCLVVAAPVAAGWMLAVVIGGGWVVQRAASLADPAAAGSMRLGQWGTAAELVTTAPFFGHGLGLTHWVWAASRLPDRSLGVYPHNDYIQYAIETGVPGALLWVALIGTILWAAARHGPGNTHQGRMLGAAAAIAAVAAHAAFSYHLQLAPVLLLLGMLMAVVARATPDRAALIIGAKWWRTAVLAVLLLHATLLAAYGLAMPSYRIPASLSSQSWIELTEYPGEDIVRRLSLAARLQPHATEARLKLASALWSACLQRQAPQECGRALRLAETAVRRNPVSYEARYLRGKYAGDVGDLMRALEMHPGLTAARMEAANLLLLRGNPDGALSVLEQGLHHLGRPTRNHRAYLDYTERLARLMERDDVVASVRQVRARTGHLMDRTTPP